LNPSTRTLFQKALKRMYNWDMMAFMKNVYEKADHEVVFEKAIR
jgi:hypothetical protein